MKDYIETRNNIQKKSLTLSETIINQLHQYFTKGFDPRILNIYIPSLAANDFLTKADDSLPTVQDRIMDILNKDIHRSIVVFGGSGLGKTTLLKSVYTTVWQQRHILNRLPIYIHLQKIIKKEKLTGGLLDYFLKKIVGISSEDDRIKISQQPLLLLLDGLDEIQVTENLYLANHWYDYDTKVVTTCRPEAVQGKSLPALFEAINVEVTTQRYVALYLQVFTQKQINTYIDKFAANPPEHIQQKLSNTAWLLNAQQYHHWLSKLTDVDELITNPFLLSIIVQAFGSK